MKKLSLSILAVALSVTMASGQTKAPIEVQKAFSERFTEAKSVKWEKETDGTWDVDFKMNGNEMSAEFEANGVWVQTETVISLNDVPEIIRDVIKSDFDGYKVDEAEMVETADGDVVYEIDFEKGKEEFEVVFASDGKVLKRMYNEEDDD